MPDASWRAESWASTSYDNPNVGAPPLLMAFPSGATNCAYPLTVPSANSTPGIWRTVVAIDCGTGLRPVLAPALVSENAALPRISKSTF